MWAREAHPNKKASLDQITDLA